MPEQALPCAAASEDQVEQSRPTHMDTTKKRGEDPKLEAASSATLRLEGAISPDQFIEKLKALKNLLNREHALLRPDENASWLVQVSQGSNAMTICEQPLGDRQPIMPQVIRGLDEGIKRFGEDGTVADERGMAWAKDLAQIAAPPSDSAVATLLLQDREGIQGYSAEHVISEPQFVDSLRAYLKPPYSRFSESGAVEGRLQVLDVSDANKRKAHILDPLRGRKVACTFDSSKAFEEAYSLLGERVEATGLVRCNVRGQATSIQVSQLRRLPEEHELSDFRESKGALKGYV